MVIAMVITVVISRIIAIVITAVIAAISPLSSPEGHRHHRHRIRGHHLMDHLFHRRFPVIAGPVHVPLTDTAVQV